MLLYDRENVTTYLFKYYNIEWLSKLQYSWKNKRTCAIMFRWVVIVEFVASEITVFEINPSNS